MPPPFGRCWTGSAGQGFASRRRPASALGGSGAAQYNTAESYGAGDYCTKDGKLYRCTAAVTAGSAWDAASWRETSAAQKLQVIQAAVGKSVPARRTVNGKALSTDITLSASDVGAMPAGGDSGAVPAGLFAICSSSASTIPNGWALCNGQNGTPDLRNRFVLGAGSSYSVGATGGEKMHTLTIDEMPSHTHNGFANDATPGRIGIFTAYHGATGSEKVTYTGGSQAHNNMPPYYALCFIIKL